MFYFIVQICAKRGPISRFISVSLTYGEYMGFVQGEGVVNVISFVME